MTKRIKCTSCPNMILPATAANNDGHCGPCAAKNKAVAPEMIAPAHDPEEDPRPEQDSCERNLPRVYRVEEVDKRKPSGYGIYYRNSHEPWYDRPRCSSCRSTYYIPSRRYFMLDECTKVPESSAKGFVNGTDDYDLICLHADAMEISKLLSGVMAWRVAFGQFGEGAKALDTVNIPVKARYTQQPQLSQLLVTGRCFRIIGKPGVVNPRICQECSRQELDFDILDNLPSLYSLDPLAWDGSDVFRLEGSFRPIVTEIARSKFQELGFDNLVYTELNWA